MEASGTRRPLRGAALTYDSGGAAVPPLRHIGLRPFSPAALAGGHGALPGSASSPPGDGPARPRRGAHPRPPQQRLSAVASSSTRRPPPRGRRSHARRHWLPRLRPRDVSAALIGRFCREAGFGREPVGPALRGGWGLTSGPSVGRARRRGTPPSRPRRYLQGSCVATATEPVA